MIKKFLKSFILINIVFIIFANLVTFTTISYNSDLSNPDSLESSNNSGNLDNSYSLGIINFPINQNEHLNEESYFVSNSSNLFWPTPRIPHYYF